MEKQQSICNEGEQSLSVSWEGSTWGFGENELVQLRRVKTVRAWALEWSSAVSAHYTSMCSLWAPALLAVRLGSCDLFLSQDA